MSLKTYVFSQQRNLLFRPTVTNAENIHIIASKPWAFALSSTLFRKKNLLFSTEDMKLYGINARHCYQWISRFFFTQYPADIVRARGSVEQGFYMHTGV